MHILVLLILASLSTASQLSSQKITGVTIVAPPRPFESDAISRVQRTEAQWAGFVPYGFMRPDSPQIRYNLDRQWWGEREEGIIQSIDMAHEKGMKVMLKPQVYLHNAWVGEVDFENEDDWLLWEKSYREFILFYLDIAMTTETELFCIGTEWKIAANKREAFWRNLIKEMRSKYDGKLVYSANWDQFESVPFWDQLDYIGISAYFPLSDDDTPGITDLIEKWKPLEDKLRRYAKKNDKQILFTEYGYLSIDKCAYKTWELEKTVRNANVNQDAQANAFAALLNTFCNEQWWAGGFIWKWFPEDMGHEGYQEKDYTPQDKKAEFVIKAYHSFMNNNSD